MVNSYVVGILFAVAIIFLIVKSVDLLRNILFLLSRVYIKKILTCPEYDETTPREIAKEIKKRFSGERQEEFIRQLEYKWKYATDPKWLEVKKNL